MKCILWIILFTFLLSSCAPLRNERRTNTSSGNQQLTEDGWYEDEPIFFDSDVTEVYANVRSRVSAYSKHQDGQSGVIADVRADVGITKQIAENIFVTAEIRSQLDTGNIHQGASIMNHGGKKTIMSMREAYVEFTPEMNMEEVNIIIGKKIMQNAVNFDFVDFNPLSRRDQSEPFSVMDDGSKDGVGVALISMNLSREANLIGECVIAGRNTPVIATSTNDHWTRNLPPGVSYDNPSVGNDINYMCRMYQERDDGTIFQVAIFNGSGSGVDHVVSKGVKIAPVFVKETAISASAEFSLGSFITRIGCNTHFQEGSDDFATCVAETDITWQFSNGSSLFIETGYANSFVFNKTDVSVSELDMRRSLDNSLLISTEYSFSNGIALRASLVQSMESSDRYFRIEAETMLDTLLPDLDNEFFQSTRLALRAEHIEGSQNFDGIDNIYGAHRNDDRAVITINQSF